ncbi:MAG: hypothetical protein ACJAT2_002823 [Bacteriovoracaceae bacterium]|jgi:hypothetical protein
MLRGKCIYIYSPVVNNSELAFYILALQSLGIEHRIVSDQASLLDSCLKSIPDLVLFVMDEEGNEKDKNTLEQLVVLEDLFGKVKIPILVSLGYENYLTRLFLQRGNIDHFYVDDLFEESFVASSFIYKIRACMRRYENDRGKLKIRPNHVNVKVETEASLLKLGEFGCTIVSPIRFENSSQIAIDSKKLKSMGISLTDLQSCTGSHFLRRGAFSTDFFFRGIPEKSAQRIRRERNKWGGFV